MPRSKSIIGARKRVNEKLSSRTIKQIDSLPGTCTAYLQKGTCKRYRTVSKSKKKGAVEKNKA